MRRACALTFADLQRLAAAGDKQAAYVVKRLLRDADRTAAEAAQIFAREVPAIHAGSSAAVRAYLAPRDVSHIQSRANLHSAGAPACEVAAAGNIKLELAAGNRARGRRDMTRLERCGIDLRNSAAAVASAAAAGAAISGALAVAVHGQAVREGRETASEAGRAILCDAASGAACGAGYRALSVLFPAAGTVLAAASLALQARAAAQWAAPEALARLDAGVRVTASRIGLGAPLDVAVAAAAAERLTLAEALDCTSASACTGALAASTVGAVTAASHATTAAASTVWAALQEALATPPSSQEAWLAARHLRAL